MWLGGVQLEPVRSARSVGIVQNCADTNQQHKVSSFLLYNIPTRWAKGAA